MAPATRISSASLTATAFHSASDRAIGPARPPDLPVRVLTMAETDLAFAGLARQAEAVRAGEVSPRELVRLYLERIGRLDPQLNAYRVVRAEPALAAAVEAEKRRHSDGQAPLLGVPIAVKDSHDVAGELTTHGTGCVDEPATEDCELVRRLRAAGAILIGKTNLPELAFAMFTESPTWGA